MLVLATTVATEDFTDDNVEIEDSLDAEQTETAVEAGDVAGDEGNYKLPWWDVDRNRLQFSSSRDALI